MSVHSDDVRAQLKRILASSLFQSSELQRQFLSFVVEKTLNGSGDEVKEYSIGAEAFGRGENVDPRLDSVVRVVARRVRKRLAEYYRTDGTDDPFTDDPLVIVLEKGGYVPSFEPRREVDAAVPAAQADGAPSATQAPPVDAPQAVPGSSPRRIAARWGSR